ncbi:MAG: carboxylating nicotinate-nucleotide diphosphorylase [Oscillospiraceae bacterium]|nr:carboxylating nicotinate-nucleotide diphosphorylase [Oscillospiraceae bacterium]
MKPRTLPKLSKFYIDDVIKTALTEDVNYIDVTTDLLPELGDCDGRVKATLTAKEDGVIAGIDIALRVFELLDRSCNCKPLFRDGQTVKLGDVIAEISGEATAVLKGERTALNLLQHMSGIATYTNKCVLEATKSGTKCQISDTRKTLPGLRALQKYSVLCGGGSNHRYNLSQAVMLKDNHIDAFGSISNAIKTVRERTGHTIVVEVEIRDLEQLTQALDAKADIIMLDNMNVSEMRTAVKIANAHSHTAKLEASGNVTLENIAEVASTGIDIISIGALTHSVRAFDISLRLI